MDLRGLKDSQSVGQARLPRKTRGGQAIVEYAIVLGLIVAAVLGMQVYAKRGIQAGLKGAADQLSPFGVANDRTGEKAQLEGMRYESGERRNRDVIAAGTVLERRAAVKASVERTVVEREAGGSRTRTIQQDTSSTSGALAGGESSTSQVVIEIR